METTFVIVISVIIVTVAIRWGRRERQHRIIKEQESERFRRRYGMNRWMNDGE